MTSLTAVWPFGPNPISIMAIVKLMYLKLL